MKQFSTIKIGYTSGIYGCSGEYFVTIITRGKKTFHVYHYGMYGSDYRVNAPLKSAGYNEYYIGSWFGKMKQKDIGRCFLHEDAAIEEIEYIIKKGKYIEK